MGKFFKKVGVGFLVVVLLPFIAAAYILFAVYAVLKFIVLWFIALSKFFIGEKITDPLDIDRKAANLFEQEHENKKAPVTAPESGKFAGATINIYSNKEIDEDFKRPPSHFENSNNTIDAKDIKEIEQYETRLLDSKNEHVVNEVEDD